MGGNGVSRSEPPTEDNVRTVGCNSPPRRRNC